MINKVVMWEYKVIRVLVVCQQLKKKHYGTLKLFYTGRYGAGDFETLILQLSSDLSQNL